MPYKIPSNLYFLVEDKLKKSILSLIFVIIFLLFIQKILLKN